jgi:ABC-type nickel/cobalt efflux system permease component RcnA
MGDKIRGTIAIVVGTFALWQSYLLSESHRRDWHLWVELAAGLVLIVMGIWRIGRKPVDPTIELLK